MTDARWTATERMVYAALAGAAAVAAPLLLYWATSPGTDDGWLITWAVAPGLGPLVFQLICRPRPEWGWGLAFAAALGVVFGIWSGLRPPFEYSGAGQAAMIGALFFVLTFLVGMVGASIATLITRLFELRPPEASGAAPAPSGAAGRFKPWHVGAALVCVETVAVAALAAATAW
jgi:hypothetical protein